MPRLWHRRYLLPVLAVLLAGTACAQQVQDTAKRIVIDRFYTAELIQEGALEVKKLSGDVLMHQGNAKMYCDTAYLYGDNLLVAIGGVVIQQGDSVQIFGDVLNYNGDTRIADMRGAEVVLVNGRQQLFANNRMMYNLNTKVGTYNEGALLDNGRTQLRSSRGVYAVTPQEAYFYGNVVVADSSFSLKTDSLKFNTATQVANFLSPTRIAQDSSRIYCEHGYYDTEQRLAAFYDNAQYRKGAQLALADTIRYDGNRKLTLLIGNARAEEGLRKASANRITFDGANDLTFLEGNARYNSDKQRVAGDTIRYNNKKQSFSSSGRTSFNEGSLFLDADRVRGEGDTSLAEGNVVYRDTAQRTAIETENLAYDRNSGYFQAFGKKRPLFKTVVDNDTLYLSADTLLSVRLLRPRQTVPDSTGFRPAGAPTRDSARADSLVRLAGRVDTTGKETLRQAAGPGADTSLLTASDTLPKDTVRLFLAYRDVRIYKRNFQAVCDSLVYNTFDSLFQLYRTPLIWTDTTTQFSADTIYLQLREGKLEQLRLYTRAMIASSKNEKTFDQVKGQRVEISFANGKTDHLRAKGNAESVFFIQDDQKRFVGPNRAVCQEMLVQFVNEQVSRIRQVKGVDGKLSPMKKINPSDFRLEGFRWEVKRRPLKVEDLL